MSESPDPMFAECRCTHTRRRHPHDGYCEQAGCGCTRFRASEVVNAKVSQPEPIAQPDPPVRLVPPQPEEPPMPPADDNAPPDEVLPPADGPTGEPVRDLEKVAGFTGDLGFELLRQGLGHDVKEVREFALRIRRMFDTLGDMIGTEDHRVELQAEYDRVTARAKELEEKLGVKRRGRPAR